MYFELLRDCFQFFFPPVRSSLVNISTVVIDAQIEESGWAVVQDVEVHYCAVTRYQTRH